VNAVSRWIVVPVAGAGLVGLGVLVPAVFSLAGRHGRAAPPPRAATGGMNGAEP
jgi:hypothetical protein